MAENRYNFTVERGEKAIANLNKVRDSIIMKMGTNIGQAQSHIGLPEMIRKDIEVLEGLIAELKVPEKKTRKPKAPTVPTEPVIVPTAEEG